MYSGEIQVNSFITLHHIARENYKLYLTRINLVNAYWSVLEHSPVSICSVSFTFFYKAVLYILMYLHTVLPLTNG